MSDKSYEENCIFCKIVQNKAPADKVYENEDVICIKDIKPASTYHFLIMPKTHVRNAKFLTSTDTELFDKIVSTVDVLCQQENLDINSTRTGFHWPPFTTVNHLHLHVICPIENMGFIHNWMFRPNSYWFVSIDYVKNRLTESTQN